MKDSILAWHVCLSDKRLGYGDGRLIVPGETLSIENDRPIRMCSNALHAHQSPADALYLSLCYGGLDPNEPRHICRVRLWSDTGRISRPGLWATPYGKLAGQHRKCLWMLELAEIIDEFLADVGLVRPISIIEHIRETPNTQSKRFDGGSQTVSMVNTLPSYKQLEPVWGLGLSGWINWPKGTYKRWNQMFLRMIWAQRRKELKNYT